MRILYTWKVWTITKQERLQAPRWKHTDEQVRNALFKIYSFSNLRRLHPIRAGFPLKIELQCKINKNCWDKLLKFCYKIAYIWHTMHLRLNVALISLWNNKFLLGPYSSNQGYQLETSYSVTGNRLKKVF